MHTSGLNRKHELWQLRFFLLEGCALLRRCSAAYFWSLFARSSAYFLAFSSSPSLRCISSILPSTYVTKGGMIILKPSFSSFFSIPFAAFPDQRVCNCVSKAAAVFPENWFLANWSRNCMIGRVAMNACVGDPARTQS